MKKYKCILLSLILFVAVLSCEEPVPLRRMSLAKMEITRALSVKADKYAPAEIKEAQEKLLESHGIIKEGDHDRAKQSAQGAYDKAVEAYNKSIPLLAKDTLAIAEKSLEQANEVYAEVLAKNEYAEADKTLKEAQDLYENKKYYESYLSSIDADKKAKNARNTALGRKVTLQDSIDEVKATLSEAKRYGADTYAASKVKLAEDNITDAQNSYSNLKLKEGFAAIEVAKVNADEAYLIALRETSKKKIAEASALLAKAEKSQNVKYAKDELEGSREALQNAKSTYANTRYKESIAASDEAIRLALSVLGAKKVAKEEVVDEEVSHEEEGFSSYTVKYNPNKRDCLWRIAERYYNNGYLWTKIYEANRDKIKNPNLIYPKMDLKIPVLKESEEGKKIPTKEEEAVKKDEEEDEGEE